MAKLHVSTTINGEPMEFLCEPDATMLDALRGPLGLTGSKEGCASGDCGACSITLDDRLVCSCLMLAVEAEGREIRTIEGMANGEHLHPLQQKFLEVAALQCGICTSGMLVASDALLRKNPKPSEEEVRFWLAGNLCRCTGYDKIVRAVLETAAEMREQDEPAMNIVTNNKWIGQRTIRPDGADKVTGRAAFAADTNMPGMIWGKILRSPHPHARIRSIDTSKAEALPGVKAVVTARDIVDFPIDKSVMLGIQDMRWMCRNVMARDKALFPGHPVAAVAATTEAIAAKACELIEVDYEVLPWSIEIDDALKPDAPILHEFIKFEGKPSNIAGKLEVKKGDVAEGFKQAEVIVERSFTTRPVHQGYIEPHACLVSVAPDNKTTIWSSSQGQFMVRAMTALSDRHSPERHPRHSGRDRRRFRRQDHRLSRAAGDPAGEEIRPSGEDGDDPRGSDAGDRARRRARRARSRSAPRRTAPSSPRRAPSICRPARCRARRSAARWAAASRPTTSRTCCRSATTCCPTAPRSRPIARRARRSAPMRWSA